MSRVVIVGLTLTAIVTVIEWMVWGRDALLPAVAFGMLATLIQVGAVWKLKPVMSAPYAQMVRGWAIGAGLRFAGIVLMVVAIVANREVFPPLPTAFGYLGVVLPLLFGEIRLSK